ncbi:MAG: acyl-CoA synthetase FdrA [Betaproteobacteria bacterium]|nr:acyl-CoA synthetase FdrA [Betaproteobacteria bacterium]
MATATRIVRGAYRDSIALMKLSAALAAMPGVEQASLVMATEGNVDLLRQTGLLTDDTDARPSDVLIVVRATSDKALAGALGEAERSLATSALAPAAHGGGPEPVAPRSTAMAIAAAPQSNLALVSVPGEYAAAEAMKALRLGLNVMLFSDGVSVEDEVAIKSLAQARNLLVMGPDCGTAIVNGVPLAFANVVRRGVIGCVGASGTGLQQITSLIDRYGQGVSHALGTGGRDLSEAVGGVSMLAGIQALAGDRGTRVLVLVSKPPAPSIARNVLAAARKIRKPTVVCFVGAEPPAAKDGNLHYARTLEDAARIATSLAARRAPARRTAARAPPFRARFARGQRCVRGLYSGGTFAYEASWLLGAALGDEVWSNAPVHKKFALRNPWTSHGHTVIDLGADEFTRGRPHPMIDHRLRNDRILREAEDPEVAVIVLDVVLGHGAHPDPSAEMVPAIRTAQAAAKRRKRQIAFVAFLCGTADDPQDLPRQEATLRDAGVVLGQSNADAIRIAAAIAKRGTAAAPSRSASKRRKA